MKRVLQYNIDIELEDYVNDMEELIAEALERFGITVFGVAYADDMTEEYEKAGYWEIN